MSLQTANLPSKHDMECYHSIAKTAASNPAWRKLGGAGSEESILNTLTSIILLGRELGLSPMISLSGGIQNIQGQFELSAKLMNNLIRKQGHQLKIVSSTSFECTIWGKRKDTGEEHKASYTIEDARAAGLVRPNSGWTKYPKDMLFARALSRLSRQLFPDCLQGGVYVEGELQEAVKKEAYTEKMELPEIETLEVIPEVSLNFELPDDLAQEQIEEYIEHCAACVEVPKFRVIEKANKNPDAFISAFRRWEDSKVEDSTGTDGAFV